MVYTLEAIEQMRAKLRELPAIEKQKQKLNKQEAINNLISEIVSLQKRGYGMEQISASLKGIGLDIATPTLRSYLQRVKTKRKKTPRADSSAVINPAKETPRSKHGKDYVPDSRNANVATSGEFIGQDRTKI